MYNLLKKYNTTKFTDEAIIYGLKVIGFNCLTILAMLVISNFFNSFEFGILFILFFSPMRMIYGGAHTKNPMTCILITSLLFFIAVIIFSSVRTTHFYLILSALSIVTIYCLKFKYRIKMNLIYIQLVISFLLFFVFGITSIISFIFALFLFEVLYILNNIHSR